MPAANPLAEYNTGHTSGMTSGTTQQNAGAGFTSSAGAPGGGMVAGRANLTVAAIVAISLALLLGLHLMGFRFAFDAAVGARR